MSDTVSNSVMRQLSETDRDRVLRFFVLFARFEYALKRTRFLRDTERAQPDWNSFTAAATGKLHAGPETELARAIDYLTEHPPLQQRVVTGRLEWLPAQARGGSVEARLVEHVKAVRNNLFHGGKFPTAPIKELARDRALLDASITVLEALAILEQDVAQRISEPLETSAPPS